jgi:hypothetical protein
VEGSVGQVWCEKPSNCQLEYIQHGGLTRLQIDQADAEAGAVTAGLLGATSRRPVCGVYQVRPVTTQGCISRCCWVGREAEGAARRKRYHNSYNRTTIATTSHSPMLHLQLANQGARRETGLAPTHHELPDVNFVVMSMRGAPCAPWYLAGGAVFRDQNGGL